MKNALLVWFWYLLSCAVGILTMIYGWGIKPKSWTVIILAGIITRLLIDLIAYDGKGIPKEGDK